MLPEPVIDREVTRQPVVFLELLAGHRILSSFTDGLDEALGLVVVAGLLWTKGFACIGKAA